MKKYIIASAFILAIASTAAYALPHPASASVSVGSSYQSATFASPQANPNYLQSAVLFTTQPTSTSTPSGVGLLGSVVITGSGAGSMAIYDATTSNASIRALATSSLPVLAQFPANAATGTYTFDEMARFGIVVEFTGAQGTSTVTYRQY